MNKKFNLPFFSYSFNKALRSPSTWITLAIASIPGYMVTLSSDSSLLSVILFFTFPIFIIFITYRAAGIFRDEIENQTMLTIQSKPIKRRDLVLQGFASLSVMVFIGIIIAAFIPGLIAVMKDEAKIADKILMSLSLYLLSILVASIALVLSLSLKGKAFIGVMLGAFGTGFYIMFGVSTYLQSKYSTTPKISHNKLTNMAHGRGITINDIKDQNGNVIINVKITDSSNTSATDQWEKIYNQVNDAKKSPYDVIKWFDPALHWGTMFGASTEFHKDNIDYNKLGENILDSIFDSITDRAKNVKIIKAGSEFTFQIDRTRTIPLWYPYILWSTIGAIGVLLSLRKIQKVNIA